VRWNALGVVGSRGGRRARNDLGWGASCRYLSRGIDDCGNVSNAVETEQVFFVPRVSHVSLASLASPGAAKGAASSTSEGKGASSETSQDASPGQQPPTTKDTCVPPTTQDTRPAGVGGTLFGGTFAPSAAAVPSVPPPPTPPACAACGVTSFVIYRVCIHPCTHLLGHLPHPLASSTRSCLLLLLLRRRVAAGCGLGRGETERGREGEMRS